MNVFEIFATKRSGHHAVISWLVKNMTGMNLSLHRGGEGGVHLNFKTEYVNPKVIHWNDANNNQPFGLKLFRDFKENGFVENLVVNYEDVQSDYSFFYKDEKYTGPFSEDRFSDIHVYKTNRLLVIRNFYNCLASRCKQNQDGIHPHDISTNFINLWKENAKFVIKNPTFSLKYEDWISNSEIRNEVLMKYLGTYEIYTPDTIQGRSSSFTNEDFNKRFLQVEIPIHTKELIRKDNELHYLIGKLGYDYQEM